mmetsp:Transcript_2463/g.6648  ORF Transcript_2463/g.6648 Transcript_2463/m.6648 type:complete len:113 (-) Transcript_2463:150-488(-)
MNKQTKLAFLAFLGQIGPTPFADAFTPTSLLVEPRNINTLVSQTRVVTPSAFSFSLNMSSGSYLGMDDDDDDEDDDDDDDDDVANKTSVANSFSTWPITMVLAIFSMSLIAN